MKNTLLSPELLSNIKKTIKLLKGHEKRRYVAEMTNKYLNGSKYKAERIFGVRRTCVELGQHELRSGIRCIEAFNVRSRKKTEFIHKSLAAQIEKIVSHYTQSDRCHNNTLGYVKITAKQVRLDLLREYFYEETDFTEATINNVLNRLGYTLKRVQKTKPLKRIPQTDEIFENHKIEKDTGAKKKNTSSIH
ncbi:MAG: hypothetical protein AAF806_30295 [Bacteroidota bacterium]